MKRRDFVFNTVGLVGISLLQINCSGSSSNDPTPAPAGNNQQGNPSCSGGAGVTYTNVSHTHTTINMTVTEINNAQAGDYALLGGGHAHTFSLTAGDFATLKSAQTVSKTDNEGHGHIINIICI